mmetsp:Transcript_4292/g.10700  ORF Transcript_4292/g.10700 Transcript_4292/m.10700 type:complete len:323 (-) Transcript_4292:306-1274(-)
MVMTRRSSVPCTVPSSFCSSASSLSLLTPLSCTREASSAAVRTSLSASLSSLCSACDTPSNNTLSDCALRERLISGKSAHARLRTLATGSRRTSIAQSMKKHLKKLREKLSTMPQQISQKRSRFAKLCERPHSVTKRLHVSSLKFPLRHARSSAHAACAAARPTGGLLAPIVRSSAGTKTSVTAWVGSCCACCFSARMSSSSSRQRVWSPVTRATSPPKHATPRCTSSAGSQLVTSTGSATPSVATSARRTPSFSSSAARNSGPRSRSRALSIPIWSISPGRDSTSCCRTATPASLARASTRGTMTRSQRCIPHALHSPGRL